MEPVPDTLGDVIRMLSHNVSTDEFTIPVRREFVLEDALRNIWRRGFKLNSSLKVVSTPM